MEESEGKGIMGVVLGICYKTYEAVGGGGGGMEEREWGGGGDGGGGMEGKEGEINFLPTRIRHTIVLPKYITFSPHTH